MRRSKENKTSGFTLIELLVVVLILGILIALALPQYLSSVATSKTSTANANAKAIATAVQAEYVAAGGGSYAGFDATTLAGSATFLNDIGGTIPPNPCNGLATLAADTSGGYQVTPAASVWTVKAVQGTACNATQTVQLGH